MEKLIIKKTFSKQEVSKKTGKPYTRFAFMANEYGDKWISGFGNAQTAQWREGDTVEVTIEKVQKDDKEFINFSLPKREEKTAQDMTLIMVKLGHLEYKIDSIIDHLTGTNKLNETSDGSPMPDFDPKDTPFA